MSPSKTIATYGARRQQIRVYIEGDLVRVRWRQGGKRLTQSYANTPANRQLAKAFAQGLADERERGPRPLALTLRDMYQRFADAEFTHLRARTQKLYGEDWRRWEVMWGRDFPVEQTTLEMVHQFRRALTQLGLSINTIRHTIQTVKMVYKWAQKNELLEVNKLPLYEFKVARGHHPKSPDEFRGHEFAKIMAALDPESATQWRAFVALSICGAQGVRQNAALHLQWDDIEDAVITWRAAWDKMGREWKQPIRKVTRVALEVAAKWREQMKYEGPWVIPSGSSKNDAEVYSAQSLWLALKSAEKRAGIEHKKGRGAHGFRRMLAGDVVEVTGDPVLGMAAIGDTDVRMASRYVKHREDRIHRVFQTLDQEREEPESTEEETNADA